MSDHSDFDDEFRTDWERQADEDDERQVLELALLDRQLDDEQAALERLASEDYLGLCMFGDRPGWIEKRLSRNTPK